MERIHQNTPDSLSEEQDKSSTFLTQEQKFYQYLFNHTVTAEMAAKELGIYHQNLCRYKRWFEKEGKLAEVFKARCKVTGFQAWYISTNPIHFPKDPQTKLFD